MFADYPLKTSAEAVRDDLARARLSAVQEGVEYHFRAEPGGGHWVVVPGERDVAGSPDAAPAYVPVRSGTLASGVTFLAADQATPAAGAAGGTLDPALFAGLPDAAMLAGLRWADPVVFLPDGTAVAGAVAVGDEDGRMLRVGVRPLTGAATVGAVEASPAGGSR